MRWTRREPRQGFSGSILCPLDPVRRRTAVWLVLYAMHCIRASDPLPSAVRSTYVEPTHPSVLLNSTHHPRRGNLQLRGQWTSPVLLLVLVRDQKIFKYSYKCREEEAIVLSAGGQRAVDFVPVPVGCGATVE